LQEPDCQHPYKISYHWEEGVAPARNVLVRMLREEHLPVKVLLTQRSLLDVVPLRSGKGQSTRYVALRWGIPFDRVLYYARRASDHGALSGHFLGVLGADHAEDLDSARDLPSVYVAEKPNFAGLWEGIQAYRFDSDIFIPKSAKGLEPDGEGEESVLSADLTIHTGEEA
ncbi:MAG: HAD family hydrolase, partial [Verrucomicrobiales bacterium]